MNTMKVRKSVSPPERVEALRSVQRESFSQSEHLFQTLLCNAFT